MTEAGGQAQQGRFTLGNDQIHVRFRDNQDQVRHAIDTARSVAAGITAPTAPDQRLSLPVQSFREIVDALRLTHKTLGETIHQDLSVRSDVATPTTGRDAGREPPPADYGTEENEVVRRFWEGEPQAREALRMAQLHSEHNEDAWRRGDQIEVPVAAFNTISDTLVESNKLLVEVLASNLETLKSKSGSSIVRDHGDYGANSNWYNTGDWFHD